MHKKLLLGKKSYNRSANRSGNRLAICLPPLHSFLALLHSVSRTKAGWAFFLACAMMPVVSHASSLVPEREIKQQIQNAPDWKALWDEARQLARAGDYQTATEKYETLLSQKGNLREAQWELVKIRLHLKQPDKAAAMLELLIEAEPDRLEYLNCLARIMQDKGHFSRAVDLLAQAHAKHPDDVDSIEMLVRSLITLGKKKEALPYFEEFHQKKPDDMQLRKELAVLAYELGAYEKSRPHLVALAGLKNVEPRILLMAARVHNNLGFDEQAVVFWKQILAVEPGNREGNRRLADFYESEGRMTDALGYLLALLERNPDNFALIEKVGRIYLGKKSYSEALPYFERYIAGRPEDREALRSAMIIHAALGNKEEILTATEQYFAVESPFDAVNPKQAERRAEMTDRFREALPLYQRLLEVVPADPDILTTLVNDLLEIGEESGTASMRRHLDRLAPNRADVYRPMADLLERLGRKEELLEVIEAIHNLEPADDRITLRLVTMHLERGDLLQGQRYLEELVRSGPPSTELLAERGPLFEKLLWREQALKDYEELLRSDPKSEGIRMHALRLSGELGRLSKVQMYLAALEAESGPGREREIKLLIGKALQGGGAHKAAMREYRGILATDPGDSDGLKVQTLLQLATLYDELGLPFEAEQELRIALSRGHDTEEVRIRLFEQALAAGRVEDAETWLHSFLYSGKDTVPDWKTQLLKVRLLTAQEEYRSAIRICKRELFGRRFGLSVKAEQEFGLALGQALLGAGGIAAAEKQCRLVWERYGALEALVLLELVQEAGDTPEKAVETFTKALAVASRDFGNLLRLAELYREHRRPKEMAQVAKRAYQTDPGSLKAGFLLAEAWELAGNPSKADAVLEEIMQQYPENIRALAARARLLYAMGKFAQAHILCDKVLQLESRRPDLLLLKARIFWAQNHWPEALKIYKEFLEIPVDDLFEAEVRSAGLIGIPLAKQRSFWEIITFSAAERTRFLKMVMSLYHAVDNSSQEKQRLNRIAAPLYSIFRWQEQAARDLKSIDTMHQ